MKGKVGFLEGIRFSWFLMPLLLLGAIVAVVRKALGLPDRYDPNYFLPRKGKGVSFRS